MTCLSFTGFQFLKIILDIILLYSIWNYNELKKVIPNAIHVTLLRDPVNCYESNYVYMGLEKIFRYLTLSITFPCHIVYLTTNDIFSSQDGHK